jgi:hypothetical protein
MCFWKRTQRNKLGWTTPRPPVGQERPSQWVPSMAPDERFPVAHATVYDVETYRNYVLFAFREPDARVHEFEATPEKPLDVDALRCYLNGRLLVGFNSNRFDDLLLDAALARISHRWYGRRPYLVA